MMLSIVMATKDSEKFVAESIQSLMSQTRPADEIVLIDKKSSDRTLGIVSQFPGVKVRQQQSTGFQNAWNEGIRHAAGDLIGFLDSDDRMHSDALKSALRCFELDHDVDVVFGRVQFFCEEDHWPSSFRSELRTGSHEADIPGCMVVRRRVFDRLGLFPSDWQILADVVWFADMRRSNVRVVRNPLTVLEKRVRRDSLSLTASGQVTYRTEMLRLARREANRKSDAIGEAASDMGHCLDQ
jgi:glycosyltransferase involved in cell wall biosynthesis